jgi:NAD-dependent SIR2 family protein deacetylase
MVRVPSLQPTLTHYFIKLLAEKKLLVRNYTQNIDALERLGMLREMQHMQCHTFLQNHRILPYCRHQNRPDNIIPAKLVAFT